MPSIETNVHQLIRGQEVCPPPLQVQSAAACACCPQQDATASALANPLLLSAFELLVVYSNLHLQMRTTCT